MLRSSSKKFDEDTYPCQSAAVFGLSNARVFGGATSFRACAASCICFFEGKPRAFSREIPSGFLFLLKDEAG